MPASPCAPSAPAPNAAATSSVCSSGRSPGCSSPVGGKVKQDQEITCKSVFQELNEPGLSVYQVMSRLNSKCGPLATEYIDFVLHQVR